MVPKYPFRVVITEGLPLKEMAHSRETLHEAMGLAKEARAKPRTRSVRVYVCIDEYTRGDPEANGSGRG